jgi:hypothetical protein
MELSFAKNISMSCIFQKWKLKREGISWRANGKGKWLMKFGTHSDRMASQRTKCILWDII